MGKTITRARPSHALAAQSLRYMPNVEVSGARSLVTVALVLYGVFGLFLLLLGAALLTFMQPFNPFSVVFLGLGFSVVFLGLGFVSFVMLIIVYTTVQEPLKRGDVVRAASPALVLGILSLLFTNLISGILLLIAYARISRAEALIQAAPWGRPETGEGSALAPAGGFRYCPSCRAPLVPPYGYCTNCGHQIPPVPGSSTND